MKGRPSRPFIACSLTQQTNYSGMKVTIFRTALIFSALPALQPFNFEPCISGAQSQSVLQEVEVL
jgi:hypothetical protein